MFRTARLPAVLAALALAVSACGSDATSSTTGVGVGVDRIANAVDEVSDASTGRFEMTMAYEGMPGLGDVALSGSGEYDIDAEATRVVVDMGDMLGDLGEGLMPPGFGGSVETITVGTTVYTSAELFSFIPGVDAEWIRMDLAEIVGLEGGDLAGLNQNQGVDPAAQLEQLRSMGSIEEVGSEDVRGVATTHYAGELRLGDALDELEEEQRQAMAALYGGDLEAVRDVTVPIDVWVDADDLVRRLEQRIDFDAFGAVLDAQGAEGSEGLDGVSTVITVEYFDVGVDITIEEPQDAVDFTDVFGADLFEELAPND